MGFKLIEKEEMVNVMDVETTGMNEREMCGSEVLLNGGGVCLEGYEQRRIKLKEEKFEEVN